MLVFCLVVDISVAGCQVALTSLLAVANGNQLFTNLCRRRSSEIEIISEQCFVNTVYYEKYISFRLLLDMYGTVILQRIGRIVGLHSDNLIATMWIEDVQVD